MFLNEVAFAIIGIPGSTLAQKLVQAVDGVLLPIFLAPVIERIIEVIMLHKVAEALRLQLIERIIGIVTLLLGTCFFEQVADRIVAFDGFCKGFGADGFGLIEGRPLVGYLASGGRLLQEITREVITTVKVLVGSD